MEGVLLFLSAVGFFIAFSGFIWLVNALTAKFTGRHTVTYHKGSTVMEASPDDLDKAAKAVGKGVMKGVSFAKRQERKLRKQTVGSFQYFVERIEGFDFSSNAETYCHYSFSKIAIRKAQLNNESISENQVKEYRRLLELLGGELDIKETTLIFVKSGLAKDIQEANSILLKFQLEHLKEFIELLKEMDRDRFLEKLSENQYWKLIYLIVDRTQE